MTNKMPEVRKRYKFKIARPTYTLENIEGGRAYLVSAYSATNQSLKTFWDVFEELPSETKEEPCSECGGEGIHALCSKDSTCYHIWAGKRIGQSYEDCDKIKLQESDKVQVALESLKEELEVKHPYGWSGENGILDRFYDLKEKAQSLVDALEEQNLRDKENWERNIETKIAEFDKRWEDYESPIKTKQEKPEIKVNLKEVPFCNSHHKRLINDFAGCEDCQEEFRNNPKLGEEKPESIWRPVSELPEKLTNFILKTKKWGDLFSHWNSELKAFMMNIGEDEIICPQYEIIEYCTLADYNREHEFLKSRIEKLERMMEGR